MNRSGVIYQIACSATGKSYIGSTVDADRRFYLHRRLLLKGDHHSPKLQNAWNKYGADAFTFQIVEVVGDSLFLVAREQFWIWRNEGSLLNCSLIAGSPLGVRRTDEQKARMSAAKKAFIATEAGRATIEAMHAKNRGRKQSDAEKKKRSDSMKGKPCGRDWTPEARAQHSIALTGRKMPPVSAETCKNISNAKKGKGIPAAAIARSVELKTAFIAIEVHAWAKMKADGCSLREIERVTGRSRSVVARELKALAL